MRPILQIDQLACHTCTSCQARLACKTRAIIQFERGDLPVVETDRCLGCLACVPACLFGAVRRLDSPMQPPPR